MKPERGDFLPTLLALLIGTSALFPPETSVMGWILAVTLAAGSAFALSFQPAAPSDRGGIPLALTVAVIYLSVVLLASAQPHRSLSVLVGASLGLVAFVAARREKDRPRSVNVVVGSVVAVASLASLHALYQRAFGLAEMARELRALSDPVLDSLVIRAESGRAFGPFPLPSALGVYLAMALPLTLRGWLRSRTSGRGGTVWLILGLLQAAGLVASLSFGAVLSLVVASLMWLALVRFRKRLLLLFALPGLAGSLLALFAWARQAEGFSPMVLRARNWAAAGRVFLEHPWLGVGPGNFVDAYTQYLGPGMNETAYVHNSYLQVATEGGFLALVWVALAVGLFLSRSYRKVIAAPHPGEALLLVLPPTVFLVHNLVDFSAYLPSLFVTFGALTGLAMAPPSAGGGAPPRMGAYPAPRGALLPAILMLTLGGAAWGYREAGTRFHLERARGQLTRGDSEGALESLNEAVRGNPPHPDPPALLAEIYFSRIREHPEESERGEQWARRAVELRPRRAYGHYLLSQYRLRAGDLGTAWVHLAWARRLFPDKPLYREEAARLRGLLRKVDDRHEQTAIEQD